ncbi:hypothetical protein HYN48_08000 [Flavobacterium magnum]|uniref:Uncharacterized protein n=1 Tax=Flavobacterium magnum TaxID=2162713 RepID=A0A2S0REG5_9FLAO|nr:outer membrane beta-barrel protein [Flavobacterium magnum]AWA30024.1 hypothetical protein HYN48_08000 [Flavobacterium magnum]
MRTLLYFFVLITTYCHAQNAYEAGYYIDNYGTKKIGFVENNYWSNTPSLIKFKADAQSVEKSLDVKDVREFGIGETIKYVRETVDIDLRRTTIMKENNSMNGNPEYVKKMIFLKVLIEGDASLYAYVNDSQPKYFLSTGDGIFKQLFLRVYVDNDAHEQKNTAYKMQLFEALKCDKLTAADFRRLPYTEKSISDVVRRYNDCRNSESKVYAEKQRKSEVKYSVIAGLGLTTFKVGSLEGSFENGSGSTFVAGAEVSLLLPFNNKRMELFLNTVVEKADFKLYSRKFSTGSLVTYIQDYVEFKATPIDINVGTRYYFIVNEKNRVFLSGAFGVCLANGTITYSKDRYTPTGIENIARVQGDTETAFNAKLGAGYMFGQKISLNLDYDVYAKNFYNEGGINASKLAVLAATIRYRLN